MNYYGGFDRSALHPSAGAHQRLLDALAPQEAQTVPRAQEGPRGVGAGHGRLPVHVHLPVHVRLMGIGQMDSSPVTRAGAAMPLLLNRTPQGQRPGDAGEGSGSGPVRPRSAGRRNLDRRRAWVPILLI